MHTARRPSSASSRPPQLNADVDAPTRDLLEKLGALWGLKRGKVIRELGRIALGQRPPLTAAERQALDIIALPPRRTARRRTDG